MFGEKSALTPRLSTRDLEKYFQMCGEIDRLLEGDEFHPDDRDRQLNYFGGVGAVLSTYRVSSGRDRVLFIRAMGGVLVSPGVRPSAKADLLGLVAALDLSELQSKVDELRVAPDASDPRLSRAIEAYDGMRNSLAG